MYLFLLYGEGIRIIASIFFASIKKRDAMDRMRWVWPRCLKAELVTGALTPAEWWCTLSSGYPGLFLFEDLVKKKLRCFAPLWCQSRSLASSHQLFY